MLIGRSVNFECWYCFGQISRIRVGLELVVKDKMGWDGIVKDGMGL